MQERDLTQQEQSEFASCADAGLKLLELSGGDAPPQRTLEAIETYLDEWRKPKGGFLSRLFASKPDSTQAALALGSVWGNQIVRAFDWQWVCAQSDGKDFYCVVSPDRSLAIYPTYFMKGCLDNPAVDCTAVLAFNMLAAGSVGQLPPGGYTDLMSGVHRVVPR